MIGPGVIVGPELERIVSVAPYGFRLWDIVAGRSVAHGLQVVLRTGSGRRLAATSGPSDVFAIHHVPGLDAFEHGVGDDAFWSSPPPVQDIGRVEVDDPLGRFLPFSFQPDAPARIGRFAREVCGPPDGAILGLPVASPVGPDLPILPLFSSAGRPTPQGMARVSAQLETGDGTPAAGAVLVVRPPGESPAYGLADGRGVATVFVPYPRPTQPLLSPPSTESAALATQAWDDVAVSVHWVAQAPSRHPDLCHLLSQLDTPAVVVLSGESPAGELLTTRLRYGMPLDLRTSPLSVLIVEAGSPPSP